MQQQRWGVHGGNAAATDDDQKLNFKRALWRSQFHVVKLAENHAAIHDAEIRFDLPSSVFRSSTQADELGPRFYKMKANNKQFRPITHSVGMREYRSLAFSGQVTLRYAWLKIRCRWSKPMKCRAFLSAIVVVSLSSLPAFADEQSSSGDDGDIQDIVYLGSKHPVFLRVHLRIDGKGFRTLRRERAARLFKELDQDGNGHLDIEEAKHVPPPNQISRNSSNSRFFAGSIDISPSDQKISQEELARYVAIVSGHPFRIQFSLSSGEQSTGLFTKLDIDGDMSLSQDELERASDTLRKVDLDDDGAISRLELQPLPNAGPANVPAAETDNSDKPRHFHAITPYVLPKRVAETIIKTYADQEHDSASPRMSHQQLGVSRQAVAKFDSDGDRLLNRQELIQFLRAPAPHVEVQIRLPYRKFGFPRISGKSQLFEVTEDKRRRAIGLDFNNVGIELRVKSNAAMKFDNQQFYKVQFLRQDADKNNYLDEAEFNGLGIPGATFATLDKNGDGMLYVKEVTEFVNRLADASQSSTIMSVTTTGKPLFDLLDVYRDARLTPRELSNAFKRLTTQDGATQLAIDADADGRITATEIDGQYRVTFEMGKPDLFDNMPTQMERAMGGGVRNEASLSGPVWFQKMDKNRDDDVSQKEFLGSKKDFKKLDANNDGLIDEQEATRASK